MSYTITGEDKRLVLSRWLSIKLKLQILNNDDTILDEIIGFTDLGSISIDASSYSRRSYSFTIVPDDDEVSVSEESKIWINKTMKVYVGLKTPRDNDYKWYPCGQFLFTDTSSSTDAQSNTLTVNCGDMYQNLDGSVNGKLDALTTTIPAYDEDEDGNPIRYNIIRDSLQKVLVQLGGLDINKIFIDDIGELNGLEKNNKDYQTYRNNHPLWNCIPYDLEFSVGSSVGDIITNIVELYPDYDACFDENGNFIATTTPSCYEDDVILENDDLQRLLVSESVSTDLSVIRNIVHVWGKTYEVDWYTEECTNSGGVYAATIKSYEDTYINGDLVAIKVPSTNTGTQHININGIGNVRIYDEYTDEPLVSNTLQPNTVYVFKYRRNYIDKAWDEKIYLQGQWQAHGLCALVDGTVSAEQYQCSDETTTPMYSKKYFQDKYAVECVELKVIPNSPFTVQKIGERIDPKSDSEYENISSDSLAVARAEYELYKDARLTDNITLTLRSVIPWLKEYMKVSYIKKNEKEEYQYITQKVDLNFNDCTTTVTMYRFYPTYEE